MKKITFFTFLFILPSLVCGCGKQKPANEIVTSITSKKDVTSYEIGEVISLDDVSLNLVMKDNSKIEDVRTNDFPKYDLTINLFNFNNQKIDMSNPFVNEGDYYLLINSLLDSSINSKIDIAVFEHPLIPGKPNIKSINLEGINSEYYTGEQINIDSIFANVSFADKTQKKLKLSEFSEENLEYLITNEDGVPFNITDRFEYDGVYKFEVVWSLKTSIKTFVNIKVNDSVSPINGTNCYAFLNAHWECEDNIWESDRDGLSYDSSNNGVEIRRNNPCNLISNKIFNRISKVEIVYYTNKSDGNAEISVGIDEFVLINKSASHSGGTAHRKLIFDFETAYNGSINISFKGKLGSVYINSIIVTYDVRPIFPNELIVNDTLDLNTYEPSYIDASFSPSDANRIQISFASDDDNVASVNELGVVTGHNVGQCNITVTLKGKKNVLITKNIKVNVTKVYISKISFTLENRKVRENEEVKIDYELEPSYSSKEDLIWSSSNENVATVDNNGLVTGIKKGEAIITAKSIDSDAVANCYITVTQAPSRKYTIMLYMSGNNLESDNALATSDIKEICSAAKANRDDVTILIRTGGAKHWNSFYGIDSSKAQIWRVNGSTLVLEKEENKKNMGLSSSLQSFVEYGILKYSATKMSLILWNHGSGINGVCFDEQFNDDALLTREVASAMKNAYISTNFDSRFEWVGYDACLMGIADIASINSDYFNYMVASQELESGYGWDYDTWIDDVYTDSSIDSKDLLPIICKGFIDDNGGLSSYNDQTLSAIDLRKMDVFVEKFESYCEQINCYSSSCYNNITQAYKNSLRFAYVDGSYYYGVADFVSFLNKMNSYFSVSSKEVEESLKNCIVCNKYGGHYRNNIPCGLSVFVAYNVNYTTYRSDYTFEDSKLTRWVEINRTYGF